MSTTTRTREQPESVALEQENPAHSNWVWLLSLYTVAGFIEVIFWSQMQAFTPLYLPRLGISPNDVGAWTGAIATISTAVGVPFLPLWGALADRYARQPIIVRSFVAHLLAGVIAILAGNIWIFVLGRAVQSFALGNSGLMMTTLSERTPKGRVGLAFSIMNGASPLGAFVGPLVGGPVVDAWGFPALLGIDVALMLAVILALSFGYRDNFVGTNRGPVLRMAVESITIIWRSPRLRVLFPALFLLFGGWMLAFAYVPLVIKSVYSGPNEGTVVGIVLGAAGATTLVISPFVGALADRFGHWRVLFVSASLGVLLWPLPFIVRDLVGLTVLLSLVNGISSAVFAISFSVLSSSCTPDVRGRVMTFSYLPVNIGYAAGPAIGIIVTQLDIFGIFPAAAVLTALGIATLAVASRRHV